MAYYDHHLVILHKGRKRNQTSDSHFVLGLVLGEMDLSTLFCGKLVSVGSSRTTRLCAGLLEKFEGLSRNIRTFGRIDHKQGGCVARSLLVHQVCDSR